MAPCGSAPLLERERDEPVGNPCCGQNEVCPFQASHVICTQLLSFPTASVTKTHSSSLLASANNAGQKQNGRDCSRPFELFDFRPNGRRSLTFEFSSHANPKMQSGRSGDVFAHHRSHAGGSVTAPRACLPPWREVFRAGLGSEPYCESGTKRQSRRPSGSQGSPKQISRRLVSGEKSGDHFLRKSLFSFSSMSRAVMGQA